MLSISLPRSFRPDRQSMIGYDFTFRNLRPSPSARRPKYSCLHTNGWSLHWLARSYFHRVRLFRLFICMCVCARASCRERNRTHKYMYVYLEIKNNTPKKRLIIRKPQTLSALSHSARRGVHGSCRQPRGAEVCLSHHHHHYHLFTTWNAVKHTTTRRHSPVCWGCSRWRASLFTSSFANGHTGRRARHDGKNSRGQSGTYTT